MGTSGNPAVAAKQVSSASSFKKRMRGELLPLPSGEVVRARHVELQSFILQGTVPNPLMEIVSEALEKGQGADIETLAGVEEGKLDIDTVKQMYEIVDALVCASVLEPKVLPVPEGDQRDDELLYVDELDPMDKMYIFQWCTGAVKDLESFRSQAGAGMDALAQGQVREHSSE